MNGHIIEGTPIAVDFWKIRECPQVKLFFLSHVHDDHIKGLTSSWRHPIYTSPVSAKLLIHLVKVDADLVKVLEVGESHLIPLGETGEETMTVTLIDASHCPGAVMFLFEGYFGNILYTGDFRFDASMRDSLVMSTVLSICPSIDRLYLDNTYCSPDCVHPTREEATEKILDVIRASPPNARVVLGMRRLGKEDLLVRIAQELHEWIVVDTEAHAKMKALEMTDVFTVDNIASRIQVRPFHQCRDPHFQKSLAGEGPVVVILPTSILGSTFGEPWGPRKNIYTIPYSDHSSYPELLEFVARIRPRRVVPIVNRSDPPARANMSVFDHLVDSTPSKPFETPACVENWHCLGGGRTLRPVKLKRKRSSAPNADKGVTFIDEDSVGSEPKVEAKPEAVDSVNGKESRLPQAAKDGPDPPEAALKAGGGSESDYESDSGIFAELKKFKLDSSFNESFENPSAGVDSSGVLDVCPKPGDRVCGKAPPTDGDAAGGAGANGGGEPAAEPILGAESGRRVSDSSPHAAGEVSGVSEEGTAAGRTVAKDGDPVPEENGAGGTSDGNAAERSGAMDGGKPETADEVPESGSMPDDEIFCTYVETPGAETELASAINAGEVADAPMLGPADEKSGESGGGASIESATESDLNTSAASEEISPSLSGDSADMENTAKLRLSSSTTSEEINPSLGSEPMKYSTSSSEGGAEEMDLSLPVASVSSENVAEEEMSVDVEAVDDSETPSSVSLRKVLLGPPDGSAGNGGASSAGDVPGPPPAVAECMCVARWRLEAAIVKALAYLSGEPFKPFVFPQNHICPMNKAVALPADVGPRRDASPSSNPPSASGTQAPIHPAVGSVETETH